LPGSAVWAQVAEPLKEKISTKMDLRKKGRSASQKFLKFIMFSMFHKFGSKTGEKDMEKFVVHPRLESDCFVLGQLGFSMLLLMNNSLIPWFILVPRTAVQELFELEGRDQAALLAEINAVSKYVKGNFNISKLNVAAIGNIVSQFHVHIVGRDPSDYCWPDVVWGNKERKRYTEDQVQDVVASISANMGDKFTETPS
jgi:diadenosine tetraphosphate (Ap4A) HIT family hydrolase